MKKFIAVVTSMAMAASLLTACGSNAASTETTTAAASEAASEKETAGKEAENTEAAAKTDGAASAQFQSSILFCGSTSLYPILSSLASSFTEKYVTWDAVDSSFPDSNISVYVAPGGSGVGVSAAIDGTADFGMLARDIKDDMPVETIRQIFAGEIATWDQVDSTLPAEAINVYIRDLSGGAYEVFQKSVMGDSEVTASATQSASMTELATNIAGDKWGIGYAGFGAYNKANADGQVLTAMKVDGVEATAENIISGAYTIQRPVMFVTGAEITPSEQAFIDYIFSQTGYDVVEANGYIPAFTPEA